MGLFRIVKILDDFHEAPRDGGTLSCLPSHPQLPLSAADSRRSAPHSGLITGKHCNAEAAVLSGNPKGQGDFASRLRCDSLM